jgi:hypothetical protein
MYTGSWVMVQKPVSSHDRIAQGLKPRTVIHDDDAARALGLKAGIVGGLSLMSVTTGAIPASLGHSWYEGGVYSVRHRKVSYEGDVRVVWQALAPDPGYAKKIAFHLENRNGETSTYGWAAAVGNSKNIIAPWERGPQPRSIVGQDASPDVIVGATRKPFEIVVRPEDVMERDQNWWYRIASPFGEPVWSPLDIASIFYHGRRINPTFVEPEGDAPVRAVMDAGTDLIVLEPVFLKRTYVIDTRVADKWQTEKTAFMSLEYTFTDKETGRLVAISRNYSAFMHRNSTPIAAIV